MLHPALVCNYAEKAGSGNPPPLLPLSTVGALHGVPPGPPGVRQVGWYVWWLLVGAWAGLAP